MKVCYNFFSCSDLAVLFIYVRMCRPVITGSEVYVAMQIHQSKIGNEFQAHTY